MVDADYEAWARHRDLDQTIGHAPEEKIGMWKLPKLPRGHQLKILEDDDGSTIEDSKGVVLVMNITKLFDKHPDIKVNSLNLSILPGDLLYIYTE